MDVLKRLDELQQRYVGIVKVINESACDCWRCEQIRELREETGKLLEEADRGW